MYVSALQKPNYPKDFHSVFSALLLKRSFQEYHWVRVITLPTACRAVYCIFMRGVAVQPNTFPRKASVEGAPRATAAAGKEGH
jgi:hypothetical protein